MQATTIATLLTCHNRRTNTLACLAALYACELPEGYALDVFLVDDGSTDGTRDAVRVHYPAVNVIQGDGNLYWNRGMHLAWQTAAKSKGYDYYMWLNDDTTVFEHCLNTLLLSASSTQNKAILVGTTCAEANNSVYTYGGRLSNMGLVSPTNAMQPCDYFNGNIVLIPTIVYKTLGMNDSYFRHALGDFDYGKRAVKKGIQLFVVPSTLGTCNDHEQLATWCNPSKSLRQRLRAFRTPLGHNPEEFFVYEYRHSGLIMAVWHYITNTIRVFIPQLWNKHTI